MRLDNITNITKSMNVDTEEKRLYIEIWGFPTQRVCEEEEPGKETEKDDYKILLQLDRLLRILVCILVLWAFSHSLSIHILQSPTY